MLRSACALLTALVAVAIAATAAYAADPVFPPGSRVGLVPPGGFEPGKAYAGFEDRPRNALILITEFPASVYAEFEERVAAEQMKKQGVLVETREPMGFAAGPGFLVTGYQEAGGIAFRRWILVGTSGDLTAIVSVQVPVAEKDAYPDESVRAALATVALRAVAPAEELLDALPFRLRELAGFQVARVLSGGAALLTGGPSQTLEVAEQPLLLIVAAPGGPAQPADRERFARGVLAEAPGIREIRLVRSEALRIGGTLGHEIVAEAKDAKTGADVMVAQWLRFGGGGHLRILGVARKEGWQETFSRLRAVRDGIDLK